jgi:hypothetical protein
MDCAKTDERDRQQMMSFTFLLAVSIHAVWGFGSTAVFPQLVQDH